MPSRTSKLNRMGRRRFIKTLSGLGLSGAALTNMSQEALAEVTDDPKQEVPRLAELRHTNHEEIANETAPPERDPIYYTIPRDEWIEVEATERAMHELEQALVSKFDSPLIRPSVGMITSGQRSQRGIIVEYRIQKYADGTEIAPSASLEDVKAAVPATTTGTLDTEEGTVSRSDIPVQIEEKTVEKQAYFNHKYRPVPSGAQIQAYSDYKNDNLYYNTGTTCAKAYDNDIGEYVMITAGHVFEDTDGNVQTGNTVWQPDTFKDIGTGYEAKEKLDTSGDNVDEFDAGTIRMDKGTTNKFASDAGSNTYKNERVGGIIGWDKIKDNVGNSDYKLELQGRTTGENSGKIRRTFSSRNYAIKVNSQGGDSGGPHFKDTYYIDGTYYNSIAGVHHAGTSDSSEYAVATHIGEVESEFNVDV